jgi:hypothetical protein
VLVRRRRPAGGFVVAPGFKSGAAGRPAVRLPAVPKLVLAILARFSK